MSGAVVRRLGCSAAFSQLWKARVTLFDVNSMVLSCRCGRVRPLHTRSGGLMHLTRHARGVKVWEEMAEKKAEEEFDLENECEAIIDNLKVNRYTKSSKIPKIFDSVTTTEELDIAEKTLISFRRSLSKPTAALPLVVLRACIRTGSLQKALSIIRNKVSYGVFPSRRVFHVLMDAFIREGDAAGAVAVYNQMREDEVIPDAMTFHLTSRAQVMLGTEEGLQEAESLCGQCRELEPKLGTKSYIIMIKTLLEQERSEAAVELLKRLEERQLLLPQTHLNLLTHVLLESRQLDRIPDVLRDKLCIQSEDGTALGIPQEAWPQLKSAIQSTDDVELRQKFEELKKDLKIS